MRLLYVDNYRGFSKTFIPIGDVNFLVGENSTGKSSILSLIRLLSSPYFWFEQDFNQEDVQLGSFKDIVSIDAKDRSYFKIGLIECNDKCTKKDVENAYVFLFTFAQKEVLPALSQFSYLQGDSAITAKISDAGVLYHSEKLIPSGKPADDLIAIFKKWVSNEKDNIDFKALKLNVPKRTFTYVPSFIQSAIANDLQLPNYEHGIRIPEFGRNQAYIAPIRTKPRRTYDQYKFSFSPEGDHAPYLIRKLLNDKKRAASFETFLSKFGENSGLFKKLTTNQFGKTPESPFELDVYLKDQPINIEHVGYGVSQSLPIIVELFARSDASWFTIQQPEVHLHPRAQAALGDIFYYSALKEQKKFLIETHSDYTIDRYRLNVRKTKDSKLISQVLFFERGEQGNIVTPLLLNENGDYPDNQPDSFRSFFVKEELNLLGLS